MSRSNPTNTPTYHEGVPEADRYYIGRKPITVPLKRQSKYDTDMLSLPTILAEIEDGDSHYNKFDMDLEEN